MTFLFQEAGEYLKNLAAWIEALLAALAMLFF